MAETSLFSVRRIPRKRDVSQRPFRHGAIDDPDFVAMIAAVVVNECAG